jgi:hypothetical protein
MARSTATTVGNRSERHNYAIAKRDAVAAEGGKG